MKSGIVSAMSLIVAWPFCAAIADVLIAQSDTTSPIPVYGVAVKGGAFHRTSDHWLIGGVRDAPQSFGTYGIALETWRVKGALIGLGIERALNRWKETASFDGDTRQRITAWSLYGEFGVPLWNPLESRSEVWVAFEAGRLWAIEEKTLEGIALNSTGSGSILRFKFIGTQKVSRHLSVGFEAGWQIANPTIEYKWFDEVAGDSLGANSKLKLSGPLLEARVTISGP